MNFLFNSFIHDYDCCQIYFLGILSSFQLLLFFSDATQGVHLEAIMRVPEWQSKVSRYTQKQASKAAERAANPAKFGVDGEQRQKRSMKEKMFGTRPRKYKKKFGILCGSKEILFG